LSEDEYQRFLASLLGEAIRIAKAAGTEGVEISKAEASALDSIAQDYEFDMSTVWQRVAELGLLHKS
jgi:hypothetical protein